MPNRHSSFVKNSNQAALPPVENPAGLDLIEQADETEQQFFLMMKKYNSMKSALQTKYRKAKELLEQSNQKIGKYKTKLEIKTREVKHLR